jgi:hypothetical protein
MEPNSSESSVSVILKAYNRHIGSLADLFGWLCVAVATVLLSRHRRLASASLLS